MFTIFAIVVLASGQVRQLKSEETYDTQAKCEAAMPQRLDDVRKAYAEQGVKIEIGGKCAVDGNPI